MKSSNYLKSWVNRFFGQRNYTLKWTIKSSKKSISVPGPRSPLSFFLPWYNYPHEPFTRCRLEARRLDAIIEVLLQKIGWTVSSCPPQIMGSWLTPSQRPRWGHGHIKPRSVHCPQPIPLTCSRRDRRDPLLCTRPPPAWAPPFPLHDLPKTAGGAAAKPGAMGHEGTWKHLPSSLLLGLVAAELPSHESNVSEMPGKEKLESEQRTSQTRRCRCSTYFQWSPGNKGMKTPEFSYNAKKAEGKKKVIPDINWTESQST